MKQAGLLILFTLLLVSLSSAETKVNQNNQRLKISFSERFRYVTWDNAITLNDDADGTFSFTRHRTSFMAQWYPVEKLEIAAKLTNEFRYYFKPDNRDFNLDEIFIDNLYLKWKNPFNIKGSLTLGRQNIILGEGFLVMDGSPLVGSRCIYFNAARFDWRIKKDKELTLFYLYQPVEDDILPRINNQYATLIEQPEEGFGLYFKSIRKDMNIDLYYIRKNTKETDYILHKSESNTIGLRMDDRSQEIHPFNVKVEGAVQFGNSDDVNITAGGGYFELIRKFNWSQRYFPKSLTAGLLYLSENWDPLFSRWPKWSESYIYTQIKESKVAYWNNLISVYSGMNFNINNHISLDFKYHHLIAPVSYGYIILEKNSNQMNRSNFSNGGGKTRGNLFISKIDYNINKNFSGHFLWEYFIPGDFYFEGADNYNWFRFELMYKV